MLVQYELETSKSNDQNMWLFLQYVLPFLSFKSLGLSYFFGVLVTYSTTVNNYIMCVYTLRTYVRCVNICVNLPSCSTCVFHFIIINTRYISFIYYFIFFTTSSLLLKKLVTLKQDFSSAEMRSFSFNLYFSAWHVCILYLIF